MEKDDSDNSMDVRNKVEVICCGLCSESFESRMELYQHFDNKHGISQKFRDYSVLAPKKVNAMDMTSTAPKQIQVDASRRTPIKITKLVGPVHNSTITSSKIQDNTKVCLIDVSIIRKSSTTFPKTA